MDGPRKSTCNTAARRAVHPMRGLPGVLDQPGVFLAALVFEPPGKQNRIVVARLYGSPAWAAAALATRALAR